MVKAIAAVMGAAMLSGCMRVRGDLTVITVAGQGCAVVRNAESAGNGQSNGQAVAAEVARAGLSSVKCAPEPAEE